MKYMGSKNRYAKELLPLILKHRKPGQAYVEPFCGGCNMIDKVSGLRLANDFNEYLISLFVYVQNGGRLPDSVSESEYYEIKNNKDFYPKWLVGHVGFNCSFGSKWFGGYGRDISKNSPYFIEGCNKIAKRGQQSLYKQRESIKDIIFSTGSFENMYIPDRSLIYLDPPYEGTTSYGFKFDSFKMWSWVRAMSQKRHLCFVSEYSAPEDFICVWKKPSKVSLDNRVQSVNREEKLFVHEIDYAIYF